LSSRIFDAGEIGGEPNRLGDDSSLPGTSSVASTISRLSVD
jgi:hypothetical protein